MEDWALNRRLAADGVAKAEIARKLGISRTTVIKAVASLGPPEYERTPGVTSFTPFEARVRALLVETPEMPDVAQCDLWFPPRKILLEHGTRTLLRW